MLRSRYPELRPSEQLVHLTDREAEKDLFLKYLGASTEPPVLVFYGIGGSGKTWLLQKFRKLVPANTPMAILDFDRERGGQRFVLDPAAALREIRQQLDGAAPRFDIALAMLRYKQGAAEEPNPWIDLAAELAGSTMPGASSALKALSRPVLKRLRGTSIEAFLAKLSGKQLVLELRTKTSQEIGDALLSYLAEDLVESLEVHLNQAVRIALFLDTYEAVGSDMQNEEHRRQQDRWVRDLTAKFDFALTVIAGQNRIDWAEVDPEWSDRLEQHLVGGLSERDARLFLNDCDITGRSLQDVILAIAREESGGHHCLKLGMCVDIVFKERSRGIETTAQSLRFSPGDWSGLAHRFLRSVGSDEERLWIEKLALTPRFDETAAREAFSDQSGIVQDVAWQGLATYSFVDQVPNSDGWMSIRLLMRRAIECQFSVKMRVRVGHEWWRSYWSRHSVTSVDERAALAWYHRFCVEPGEAMREWKRLAETARDSLPPRMSEHARLLTWWDPVGLLDPSAVSKDKAQALVSLGFELGYASLGNRTANLRQAITCYEEALRIYGKTESPQDWAMTQNHLGFAWWSLPTGSRIQNLRRAIGCYDAALRVCTEEHFSQEWALAQNNLGNAWSDLPDGNRGANKRKAIVCYEKSLRVRVKRKYPRDWAMTQNNLGACWNELPDGNLVNNQLRAIAHYKAALSVYRKRKYPQEWAMTQSNLGFAWRSLPVADDPKNARRAIACCKAALSIYDETTFPQDWARVQFNLGSAWVSRLDGVKEKNIRAAIVCFEAALRVFTEDDFPESWAETQINLGATLAAISTGDRARNLTKAIDISEAALRVYTEDASPDENKRVSRDLFRYREALAHLDRCQA